MLLDGVQVQSVVVSAPGRADRLALFEQGGRNALPPQTGPHRQASPALSAPVMISGPIATPRPKNACIQFMCRGPNAPAA